MLLPKNKHNYSTFSIFITTFAQKQENLGNMKQISDLMPLATLEDLRGFCMDYAKRDKKFGNELTKFLNERFIDDEDSAADFIARLEDAFGEEKNIGDHWHSYYVTDWDEVCSVSTDVLKDARRLLDMGNASAALQIAIRMFELTDAEDLNYVDEDDGDWWLADVLEDYGKLLVESIGADSVPQEEKDEVIGKLKKMVKSEIGNFGYCDMNHLLQEASAASQSDNAMLRLFDEMMKRPDIGESDLAEYTLRKIALLEKMGLTDDAKKTIEQYLYMPEVRKREVEKAVERKDFLEALRLIKGGQKIAEEQNRSIREWKKLELNIYQQMHDEPMQAKLCRELFVLEGGSMDYYHELKKLIAAKDWKAFLTKMLSETNMHAWYSSSIEADIYVEEQDWQRLYDLLMNDKHHSLDMFDNYAHHLKSTHSAELLTEYVGMLKDYASRNMGAKHYSRMRQSMEAMLKLDNGKTAAHQLAEHFREVYRRRPSFMAEIRNF